MLSSHHLPSDELSKDINQSSATARTYCSSIVNSQSPTNTEGHVFGDTANHAMMKESSQDNGAGHTSEGSYQFYEFDKLKTLEDESQEPRQDSFSAADYQRQNLFGLNNVPHQHVSNPSLAVSSEDPTGYNMPTEQVSNMAHPYVRYHSQFHPDVHGSNPHSMDFHLQAGGGITLVSADHQGSFGLTLPRPDIDRVKISRRHSMEYPASVASENGLLRGQLKRDFGSFSTRSATSLDGYNMNMNRFSPASQEIHQQHLYSNITAAPTIGKDIESDVRDFSDACDKFMENIEIQSLRSLKSSTMNERPGYSLRSVQEDATPHYIDTNDVFEDKTTTTSALDIEPIPFEETASSGFKMPEIKESKQKDQNWKDECAESVNYQFYDFYREDDDDDDDDDYVYQEPSKPCPIREEYSEGEIMPESQKAKKRRSCPDPVFSIKSEQTVVARPSQTSSHGGLGPDCLGMDLGCGKIGTSAHDPIDSQSIRSLQSSFMNEFKVLSMNQADTATIEDSALNDLDMVINEDEFDDMKTFEEIENGRVYEELNMEFGDLDATKHELDRAGKVSEEDKTSISSDDASTSDNSVKDEQNKSGSIDLTAEERDLGTSFSNVVLEQFKPTSFGHSDLHGKRKGLDFGFPGLQCRYCEIDRVEGAKYCRLGGRYFPSSIKTMSDTKKTLMTMYKHLARCPKCPPEVKQKLTETLETHDEEKKDKKHGSQKAFFLAVWFCLHEKAPKDLSEISNPRITVERR